MKTLKIVKKIALFTAAVSFVFAAVEAILTYFAIIIINQTTEIPSEYLIINALPSALPYLFIGVIAVVVVALTREPEELSDEGPQEEALPPAEEVNA